MSRSKTTTSSTTIQPRACISPGHLPVALASLVMASMRPMKPGTAAAPFTSSGQPTRSFPGTSSPAMPMASSSVTRPPKAMTICSSTIQARTTRWSAASCSLLIRLRARRRHLTPRTMGWITIRWRRISLPVTACKLAARGRACFPMGRGRVSDNVIIGNTLTHNGLGGVALHTHVGPAFGLPADDMSGNKIIGNTIAGNLADTFDTATPGRVGININSGDGGSPVHGTVISQNVISDEDIDIAVNTPSEVDIHLNSLLGGGIGVGDVCALDGSHVCTGTIDATENYWGCPAGPGQHGCTTISAPRILWIPWLPKPVGNH